MNTSDHLIETALHVFNFVVGFFIMLTIMLFNYWITISVIFGVATGYFLFRVKPNKINKMEVINSIYKTSEIDLTKSNRFFFNLNFCISDIDCPLKLLIILNLLS